MTLTYWLFMFLAAVAGAGIAVIVLLVLRKGATESFGIVPETANSSFVMKPFGGPVTRLDFEQSLDPIQFAHATEAESLDQAQLHLRHLIGDGAAFTLESLRLSLSRSDLLVGASPEAVKALRAGSAVLQQHNHSGRLLGHIVDRKSGNIIEVMKEVGTGRKVLAGAAALTTLAVSVSHMIATADLAKTLKLVDQKLDLLLAFRRIDQEAKLERIYASAKELLAAPLDDMRQMEVWRLRGELRELRAIWRRELEHHLKRIENPADEAWLSRVFTSLNTYDEKIKGQISGGTVQLMMVEYSLRVDRVLAAVSDTWTVSETSILDELSAIERVGDLLREKAEFISPSKRGSVQPVIDGIASIVAHHRALVWARPDLPIIENESQAAPTLVLDG